MIEAGGSEDERKPVGEEGGGGGGVQVDLQGNSIHCHIGAFFFLFKPAFSFLFPINRLDFSQILETHCQQRHNLRNPPS